MGLFDESEEAGTDKEEPEKPTDYTGVIIFAIVLPVLFIFRHFGKTDMGLNVSVCLGMNLLAVRIRWDLREHFWFWGVVVLVMALNLPLIFTVQWPHAWVPGIVLLPIGLADLMVTLGALRLVENFMLKSPSDDRS